jgi:cytochrome c oxidase assembly protein subunit 15
MHQTKHQPALHAFAVMTAVSTLVLICFGGLVTSHGAGLAVPDWPNSYGYNMFLFPISMWVGGIFYEHTHRLVASGVGLLTLVLSVWLWLRDPRSWVRWLGVLALVLVVVQGVLGGLRVVWLKDYLGLVHGALAQVFFVLVAAIALFTSRYWRRDRNGAGAAGQGILRWFVLGTTVLIFAQLLVGAAMRHRHAGLAIPDFPTAYGRLWPAADRASVARYNRERTEIRALNPIAAYDIHLQMLHRVVALGIVVAVGACVVRFKRQLGNRHPMTRGVWVWAGLVAVQVGLGAFTIWTGKAADVATAHVAVGSLTLCVGGLLSLVALREFAPRQSEGRMREAIPWSPADSKAASVSRSC